MISKNGFTLIELMIAIAVISILVVVAIPSYKEHIKKTRRTDAKIALVELAQAQEIFYTDKRTYADKLGNATTDDTIRCRSFCKDPSGGKAMSPEGYYELSIAKGATDNIATSYIITATAKGIQAIEDNDACPTIHLDSVGKKTPESCW